MFFISHSFGSRFVLVFEYSTLIFVHLVYFSYVALCLSMGMCVECLQDTVHAMLNKHSVSWTSSQNLHRISIGFSYLSSQNIFLSVLFSTPLAGLLPSYSIPLLLVALCQIDDGPYRHKGLNTLMNWIVKSSLPLPSYHLFFEEDKGCSGWEKWLIFWLWTMRVLYTYTMWVRLANSNGTCSWQWSKWQVQKEK